MFDIIDRLWEAGLLLKNHPKYLAVYHVLDPEQVDFSTTLINYVD